MIPDELGFHIWYDHSDSGYVDCVKRGGESYPLSVSFSPFPLDTKDTQILTFRLSNASVVSIIYMHTTSCRNHGIMVKPSRGRNRGRNPDIIVKPSLFS